MVFTPLSITALYFFVHVADDDDDGDDDVYYVPFVLNSNKIDSIHLDTKGLRYV